MIEYNVKVYESGSKHWYMYGKLHRLDGPAVEWSDGSKEYWVDGKRHRLDSPAIEWKDGSKLYWVDGKRHRLDGPAIERADGSKQYWVDGKKYTKQEWEEEVDKASKMDRLKSCLKQLLECLEEE